MARLTLLSVLALAACGGRSSLDILQASRSPEAGAASGGEPSVSAGGAAGGAFGSTGGSRASSSSGSTKVPSGGAAMAGSPGVAGANATAVCEPDPCENGGACVPSGHTRTCACSAAFTGENCELPRFEGLGVLHSSVNSCATAISGDGRVVVGRVWPTREGFRWTRDTRLVGLGFLPTSSHGSTALAANHDGSFVVGHAVHPFCMECPGPELPALWQTGLGVKGLALLPGHFNAQARGISASGSVVVGSCHDDLDTSPHVHRWTDAGAPEDLGEGLAMAVSADGQVIVGYNERPDRAFRITAQDGRIYLGALDGDRGAIARATNSDGSVVVGSSEGPSTTRAFRWQGETGMSSLGALPDDDYSTATGTNADGSVVVGYSADQSESGPGRGRAVLWDEAHGVRAIDAILKAASVELSSWDIHHASAVSSDGKVVTGCGKNPSGASEAWIARLP